MGKDRLEVNDAADIYETDTDLTPKEELLCDKFLEVFSGPLDGYQAIVDRIARVRTIEGLDRLKIVIDVALQVIWESEPPRGDSFKNLMLGVRIIGRAEEAQRIALFCRKSIQSLKPDLLK